MSDEQIVNPNNEPAPINPWIAILYKPRAAMRQVLGNDQGKFVQQFTVMLLFVTLANVISRFVTSGDFPVPSMYQLFWTTVISITMMIFFVFVGSWLLHQMGTALHASGSLRDLQASITWSYVPVIVTSLLPAGVYLIFNLIIKYVDPDDETMGAVLVLTYQITWATIGIAGGLWSAIIHCKCIGEAMRISAWKAFGMLLMISFGTSIVAMAILLPIIMFTGSYETLEKILEFLRNG